MSELTRRIQDGLHTMAEFTGRVLGSASSETENIVQQPQTLDLCNPDQYTSPEERQKLYDDLTAIRARRRAAYERVMRDRRPIGAVAILDSES